MKTGKTEALEGKFPEGVWRRACDGWMRAYEHVHRQKYLPTSRQWKALSQILTLLKADLAEWEKVAKAWLREPEIGAAKGHELHALLTDLNYIRGKIAKGTVGHVNGKTNHRAIAASREYASDIPTEERVYGAVAADDGGTT